MGKEMTFYLTVGKLENEWSEAVTYFEHVVG